MAIHEVSSVYRLIYRVVPIELVILRQYHTCLHNWGSFKVTKGGLAALQPPTKQGCFV
jgi:hypothetical protein